MRSDSALPQLIWAPARGVPRSRVQHVLEQAVWSYAPLEKIPLTIRTVPSSIPNAFATRKGEILITSGLMASLRSEAEFIFVLGHELAHIGSSPAREAPPTARTSTFENQEELADQQGVGLLNRGGYDPHIAPTFLRRLSQHPAIPPWKARAIAGRATALEGQSLS